jgi:hypothetical protein
MIEKFKKVKNLLLESWELTDKEKRAIEFLTVGNNWDISVLFYGVQEESVSILKNEFGKDFSFLLKEEIVSRMDFITLATSRDTLEFKLIVSFKKKENFSQEEKKLLVRLFSHYGNYEESSIETYIESGKILPSLTISKVQELEAGILVIEKLAVLNVIENLFFLVPSNFVKDSTSKRVTFILIDEEREWPRKINPLEYQIHVLNTVNDFTLHYFFSNLDLICEELQEITNIRKTIFKRLLVNTNFFSLLDENKVRKSSRALDELGVDVFPGKISSLIDRFNLISFVFSSILFMSASDISLLLEKHSSTIVNKIGLQNFVSLCNVSLEKFSYLSKKLQEIENIKKNYKNEVQTIIKIKEIYNQLENTANADQNLDENFLGKLLVILEEILTLEDQLCEFVAFSEVKKVKKQIEERIIEKDNLINSIIAGFKNEFSEVKSLSLEVLELLKQLLEELKNSEKMISMNLEMLNVNLYQHPALPNEEISKNVLSLIEEVLSHTTLLPEGKQNAG